MFYGDFGDWIRNAREVARDLDFEQSSLTHDDMSPVRFPALGTRDQGRIGGAAFTNVVTIPTLVYPDPDHSVETHGALEDAGHLR